MISMRDASLACGDLKVIKGMDEGVAMLFGQLIGVGTGLVKYISGQNHIGPQAFRAVYLDQRSRHRHYDCGLYSSQSGRISHALGMVSRRSGDQPLLLFLVRKLADLIISAPDLVCAGPLHVFRLKIYLISRKAGEIFAVDQLRFLGHFFHDF